MPLIFISRLDRIVGIEKDPKTAFIDMKFDQREYYKNVIGISVPDQDPVEIHIAFTEWQAQYLITKPLHSSQELISQSKDKYVFKYFLVPNFEFQAQILECGEEVEVLKPEELRLVFQKKLTKMRNKYED